MTLKDGNVRVAITLPDIAAEAFRADAERLGLSFSTYAYLVLAAYSYNYIEELSQQCNDRLDVLQHWLYVDDNPASWERKVAAWSEVKKDKSAE